MPEKVKIFEVGPRDGLQILKTIMPTEAKIKWIKALADAGLNEIEVGSFVPAKLVPQMADTATVIQRICETTDINITALVPNLRGAQDAMQYGASSIIVPISVSELHSLANTRKGTFAQIQELHRIIEWNKAQVKPMIIEAGCATAFGCSIEGVVSEARVVEVATALAGIGIDRLTLADTVGYANPAMIRSIVRKVRNSIGDILTKLHLHDTMGLGLANALAGLDEGIRCFDSASAGLGGCPFAPGASGNIVTEDLVFMLESMGFETGISLEKLLIAREMLQESLPQEVMRGSVGIAGIPKTYKTTRTY